MEPNILLKWLQMGGYASYVWSAYGITLGLLVVHTIRTIKQLRQAQQHARTSQSAAMEARKFSLKEYHL